METLEAARVGREYRERLGRVATVTARQVERRFRSADVADIDSWFDREADDLVRIVSAGHDSAASVAADYLVAHGAAHGATITPTLAPANREQIRESLRVTGPVGFKTHIRGGGSIASARRVMVNKAKAATKRLTQTGARETSMATIEDQDSIIGYERVTAPGACKFCTMLAGRGAVYKRADSNVTTNRGSRQVGKAYHDSCRCTVRPVYADSPADDRRAVALAEARQGNADRRARIEQARAAAIDAQRARLAGQRSKAVAGGPVPSEDDLARLGITADQFLQGRAIAKEVKADIRAIAKREAGDLGSWLTSNDLGAMSRPQRLRQTTDILTGATRRVRDQSGYDFLEQLDDAELRRIRTRFTDSDLYSPDLLAEQIRRKTNLDLSDDEAIDWLVDRWLQEDALRSLASGRLPRYANPDNLIPSDYAMEGYDIAKLFGQNLDDAAGHVAQIQADQARDYAERALVQPRLGPAPWEMDAGDYVRELEDLEQILETTQLAAGVAPPQSYTAARERIRELAPPDIDPTGSMAPMELYEAIQITAQTAGRLRPPGGLG